MHCLIFYRFVKTLRVIDSGGPGVATAAGVFAHAKRRIGQNYALPSARRLAKTRHLHLKPPRGVVRAVVGAIA